MLWADHCRMLHNATTTDSSSVNISFHWDKSVWLRISQILVILSMVLRQLHWLPALHCTAVCQLQDRRACVTVPVWSHQEISDGWLATCYITDAHNICIVLTLECWFFSHTDTSFNDRTFATSALWTWNSQSADLKEPSLSHGQYKRSFETILFGVWDHSAVWPHH